METKKYKTIFMGTPDFSVPALQALIDDPDFEVITVVTQPDKAVGRQQIVSSPPVKQLANLYNIPVLQPLKVKEIIEDLKKLQPDLSVVAAYGKILPKEILDIPQYKSINIHASLLPKYRGASCIQGALLNGDKTTGITIMLMDQGMDTGPIIFQESLDIQPEDNTGILHDKLSNLAKKILSPTLKKYIAGELQAQPQNESQATYVKLIRKEDGHLNFNNPAKIIKQQILAFSPWPGSFGFIDNKLLKILEVNSTINSEQSRKSGELFFNNNELYVQCQDQALEITKLQLAGKRANTAKEFVVGHINLLGKVIK